MRKEEKTRISRERILQAAIREFGENSYESGSMNSICMDNGLSKGLIYHNFKNKEDLYLCALRRCIEELVEHLKKTECKETTFENQIMCILKKREEFFESNPSFKKLFFYSIYDAPKSLQREIYDILLEYYGTVASLFSSFKFRNDKGQDFIKEYFALTSSMITCYTKRRLPEGTDILTIADEHEKNLKFFIDVIFFGIAEKA